MFPSTGLTGTPGLPKSSSGHVLDGGGRRTARTPSNPPSPLKERQSSSFFGKVTNLSQVCVCSPSYYIYFYFLFCQVVSAAVSTYTGTYNREKHFTLLIIADNTTDWSVIYLLLLNFPDNYFKTNTQWQGQQLINFYNFMQIVK